MAEKGEDYCDRMLREMQEYQQRQKEEKAQEAEDTERIQKVLEEAQQTGDRFDAFKEALSNAVDDATDEVARGLCGGLTPQVLADLTHQPV